MEDNEPGIKEKLRLLREANRKLIRGTVAEKRARAQYQARLGELRQAQRNLKLALEAMQPPLFSEEGIEREGQPSPPEGSSSFSREEG
jgi:hypothetical protein